MRTRVVGSALVLGLLGAGLTACGGSSTTSTSSGTATTSTTAAPTATSAVAGGNASSACNQAIQVAQTLGQQVQAAGGNSQAIVQAVKSTVPQLRKAANQATGAGKTALDNLANSLQSIPDGASGPAVATQITNAVSQLVGACS
jgi:hypothetical protein